MIFQNVHTETWIAIIYWKPIVVLLPNNRVTQEGKIVAKQHRQAYLAIGSTFILKMNCYVVTGMLTDYSSIASTPIRIKDILICWIKEELKVVCVCACVRVRVCVGCGWGEFMFFWQQPTSARLQPTSHRLQTRGGETKWLPCLCKIVNRWSVLHSGKD